MTDINAIVERMKNTPVRINMFTFLYGIAAVADVKVKETFVEEYTKTFINEIYEQETEGFKADAIRKVKDYIMRETGRK